jgi:hypothetical protein
MAYQLTTEGKTANVGTAKMELVKRFQEAKESQSSAIDIPIFQLVEGFPEIDHTKTDVFRDRVKYSAKLKEQIADARNRIGKEELLKLEKQLGDIKNLESGAVIDLFLSYRAVKAWAEMVNLVKKISPALANTVMVQEQLALALNRDKKGEEAEKVLLDLLKKRGPSNETYGILGRVYKDRWEAAYKDGDELLAAVCLIKLLKLMCMASKLTGVMPILELMQLHKWN